MNKEKLLGLLGLLGAAFIGGTLLPMSVKTATVFVHPFLVSWCRAFLSMLMAIVIAGNHCNYRQILRRQNLSIGLLIGAGVGLNGILFAFGIKHTTLIASQVIYTFTPIATAIVAFLLLGENINQKKIAGIIMAFIGVLILILGSGSDATRNSLGTLEGNLPIFFGMLGYTIYIIFSKRISRLFSIMEMTIMTNLSISLVVAPLAIYALYQHGLSQFNWTAIWVLLAVAINTLLFTGLSQMAIRHLSAGNASLSSLLSPEFAAIAGILVYDEKFSVVLAISMILSIGGAFLSITAEQTSLLEKLKSKWPRAKRLL